MMPVECTSYRSVAALQVSLHLYLQHWDDGTLDDTGQDTPESDIYQIGGMLLYSPWVCQRPAGHSLTS